MQQLTLQNLSDRALISDQLYRYAKGLDTCDWDLVTSVLTDPFHLTAEMLDIDRTISPQEYIELAPGKFLPGFDGTAHLNTNQLITVDGGQEPNAGGGEDIIVEPYHPVVTWALVRMAAVLLVVPRSSSLVKFVTMGLYIRSGPS